MEGRKRERNTDVRETGPAVASHTRLARGLNPPPRRAPDRESNAQ